MTEDIFRKRPILGNRILTPIRDNVSESRPVVETKSPTSQTNSNLEVSGNFQNSNDQDNSNMNTNLASSLDTLQNLINSESNSPEVEETGPVVPSTPGPTPTPVVKKMSPAGDSSVGNTFFRFPSVSPPFGGNIHSLSWSGNKYRFIEAAGSTSDYVRFNNWHLHGATVWIGTSATGAVDRVGMTHIRSYWAYSTSNKANC